MRKIVCPNCKKELDRIVEKGSELQAVKTFWVWTDEGYKLEDKERDYADYQFHGYYCPECSKRLTKTEVEKKLS